MCGFLVVFQRGVRLDEKRFRESLGKIQHRGPDFTGTLFTDYELNTDRGTERVFAGFGHHRLSVIDLDPRSHQPFVQDGKVLVYNGEIYNYRELKSHLTGEANFFTSGDTELLCRLLSSRGIASLASANGMWAFCFFDPKNGDVVAARDRYGKKPLFVYQDQNTFCLASEISPILEYTRLVPKVDVNQIDTYLMDGMLYPSAGAECYIRDIQQVATGGYLRLDLHRWSSTFTEEPALTLSEDTEEPTDALALKETLESAIQCRLVSDRNIGLLLSGGIDSSLILSVLYALNLHDSVRCFIGDTGTSDDAEYAAKCATQLGIKTDTIHVDYGAATFERFLKICGHQEKPFPLVGNSMAMAEMYARIAQYDITVVLDGTGGDEIFGGYWNRYYRYAVRSAMKHNDSQWLAESEESPYSDPSFSSADCIRSAKNVSATTVSIRDQRQGLAIAEFCSKEMLETECRDPLAEFDGDFTRALAIDTRAGRLSDWIWQNDRNAMMSSLENRSPLLDYRLFRFISTGYRAKFHKQFNKVELRTIFDAFQPLPTQWRIQKQGFRWVAGKFFEQNAHEILTLIDASKILRSRLKVDAFLDKARKDRSYLVSNTTSKMLCVAGLENSMGLSI